jgi:hypothetical protein
VLHEWVFQNNAVQAFTALGTYTVGSDCSLALSFSNSTGGTTGGTGSATFTAPLSFKGSLVSPTTGLLVIQPDSLTTITGEFVAQ